jgi:CubicO group peptidase (beta-lactamase class C family)
MRPHILIGLSFLAAASANAQQAGITQLPDSLVQRIDRAFTSAGGPTAPGCALALSRDGKVVLTRAYGLANLEDGVANTPETIFESGSVAKQFTAAAVMQLVHDGKLSLDDDIRKHLPEMNDFGKKITIRNLLTHTSGLRDWYTLAAFKGHPAGTHVHSPATILDIAAHQKTLNFEPGAEYLYSNTGYILASIIVQRVSGMPFPKFTEERLFKPLGMTHTQWRDDFTKIVKGRAAAYTGNAQRGYTLDMPFTNVIGSGGLLTTVGDWMTWNAFLDNPTAIPGGAEMVKAMTTTMTLNSGKHITYALGLTVSTNDGLREISHSGSTGGYRTFLARYPDEKASVAVMCNAGGGFNAVSAGAAATYAMLNRTRQPVTQAGATYTPTATELANYAGMYRTSNPENWAHFVVHDNQLFPSPQATRALTPTAANRFRSGNTDLQFQMKGDKVSRVLGLNANGDTVVFTPTTKPETTPKYLGAFVGSYWSDELEARFSITARDSVLVFHLAPADSTTLQSTTPDTFTSNWGTLAFVKDKAGRVTAVTLWDGRARNIRFVREK